MVNPPTACDNFVGKSGNLGNLQVFDGFSMLMNSDFVTKTLHSPSNPLLEQPDNTRNFEAIKGNKESKDKIQKSQFWEVYWVYQLLSGTLTKRNDIFLVTQPCKKIT